MNNKVLQSVKRCFVIGFVVSFALQASNISYRKPLPRYQTSSSRPNILFILVDQLRYPVVYESSDLQAWQVENLPAMTFLKNNGVNFINHYCSSIACVPSRTTLFTGQYPTLHGVSQTDGAAKSALDATMYWLNPNIVPTMGNVFSTGGYTTYYIGKWHVSHDDLYEQGSQNVLLSFDETTGQPIQYLENIYQAANRLGPYGWNNQWIGPEPHGSIAHQSGGSAAVGVSGRDEFYAQQTVELLQQLDSQGISAQPWFMVCSFVNPHDISLYGDLTQVFPTFNFTVDPTLPYIAPAPTANEDLSTKPTAQASYQTQYQLAFQPTTDTLQYRQLYYTLQKKVDAQIQLVLNALAKTAFANNTIVVFTSDHGELLGAHGNFQKWFNIYEESVHVPLIFYSPTLLPSNVSIDMVTTHVDLFPTFAGLMNVNDTLVIDQLKPTYLDAQQLVGRDLSSVVKGTATQAEINALQAPVLFLMYDQIFTGGYSTNPTGQSYSYVSQPAFINAIITQVDGQIWKLGYYFQDTDFDTPLTCSCSTPVESPPADPEYEMYNTTVDPYEENNLAGNPAYASMQAYLTTLLNNAYNQQALQPVDRKPFVRILPDPS